MIVAGLLSLAAPAILADEGTPQMSPQARPAPHDPSVFRGDPNYEDKRYDPRRQIDIYGAKRRIDEPRPAIELGRPIYEEGPFREGIDVVGRKNLLVPGFSVFGDWRKAVAWNDNGGIETGQIATRLNLDVDLKLTATERLHAFFRPVDGNGKFSRYEFFGDDRDQGDLIGDGNLETLFFEGDVGAIAAGLLDQYNSLDLPFSVGLMPLLFQNGVWLEDAFTGVAFAIPAKNSALLDISNMDITFFAAFDKVTTPAITEIDGTLADEDVSIFGAAAFLEAMQGYWELGVGRVDGRTRFDDLSYNSITAAFTRRYGRWLSNSMRAIYTFGQDRENNQQETAEGFIFLLENSIVTPLPSTLVPYINAWVGLDRPQPLADDTGILKNTGINFETDALTGFSTLDDTGHDTFGGAIGIQYLFDLDQQIVLEFAAVQVIGGANEVGRAAKDDQYALGVRYQLPLTKSVILRVDAMHGWRNNDDDVRGARAELRLKF